MFQYANLLPGDPAAYFRQRSIGNPRFNFDTTAGRYVVLCFFGSAMVPASREALDAVLKRPDLFDDERMTFFGVSADPADETHQHVRDRLPGYRFLWDFDRSVSRLYGAWPVEDGAAESAYRTRWVVLDPTLRVLKVLPIARDTARTDELFAFLESLPPVEAFTGLPMQAPIIVLPNVFEPELCARLMALYDQTGGEDSGVMREIDGKTVAVTDHAFKRRRDVSIEDPELVGLTRGRISRRVVPEIKKVHQFTVTRMERFIVACYAAEDKAHFSPHRDNRTRGTAHRRFAVSVNLNGDFDGGEVSFPEYGPRRYKAPPGGAVVFSCSLLHAVSEVTRGRRYAFLPFLYDEEAARLREENNAHLGEGVASYGKPQG